MHAVRNGLRVVNGVLCLFGWKVCLIFLLGCIVDECKEWIGGYAMCFELDTS
jgi:hypothetical protein